MAKINVYVPDELHERVKAAGDSINVSALTQQALEQKLGELAATKRNKTMNDVIDRLRASKARSASTAKSTGIEEGEKWARDRAEWVELERLARYNLDTSIDSRPIEDVQGLLYILTGDRRTDWSEAESFAEKIGALDNGLDSSKEFFDGFVEGALKVYGEVADSL